MTEQEAWLRTLLHTYERTGDLTLSHAAADKTGDAFRARYGRRMPPSVPVPDRLPEERAPEPVSRTPHEWDVTTGTTCEVCGATVGSRAGDASCMGKRS